METLYTAKTEDLIAVADAIRAKGETSAQLVFPGGFVSAIQDISGGGLELNFEIVGGTTQPSDPKENTIWVNTSTAIAGWSVSVEAPASPTAGMIWVSNEIASLYPFNAIKEENELTVSPTNVYQYISSKWQKKTSKIYQNGAWHTLGRQYLFYKGDMCEAVTGGWDGEASVNSSGQIVFEESSYIEGFSTLSKIDKGNFTKLCANIVSLNCTDVGDFNVVINTKLEATSGDYFLADAVTTTAKLASISLSSITEDFYVYLYTYKTATAKVDAVWLE